MNAILRLLVLVLLPIACIQAQIPNYVSMDSLKGWYPFSGNANDFSQQGKHGTILGPSLDNDRFSTNNASYSFDGINDIISLGTWQNMSNFTISCWINPELQTGPATIIDYDKELDSNWAFQTSNWQNNSYSFLNSSAISLKSNAWNHIVIQYSNGVVRVYLDGTLTSQTIDTVLYSSKDSLHIGFSNIGDTNYWKGKVDDMGIWNRELSQVEILSLFTSGIDSIPIIPSVKTISTVSCFGGSDGIATVTHQGGIGPFTYAWNTNPIQTTPTASNLSAGTYTVTVKDSRDSVSSASITITQPPIITNVTATVLKQVECFGMAGGSASVTNPSGGTPPYSYSWNSTPEQKTQTAIDLKAGTYTVTITDSKGCTAQSTVTVSQPNSPVEVGPAKVDRNVSCYGATDAIISIPPPIGGTPPYTVVWNTQPVRYTETVIGVKAGTYTAVIVDSKGCIAETSITVSEPEEVQVFSPVDTVVLIQTNARFAAGSNNEKTSFQWQTNIGNGFQDIQDVFQYYGTKTPVLNVLNCTLFNHNQPFRCILTTNGCYDTTDIATLSIRTNVSVDESHEVAGISISPNPIGESDQFLVHFAEIPNQDISIELLDILGSVHYSHTLQAGSESCTIPVQGLSSGMYMLRLRMNNEVFIEKVIVN